MNNSPSKALHYTDEDRILFISDLHLEVPRQDILQGFLKLLSSIIDANRAEPRCDNALLGQDGPYKALFILGDFFEVWIGDDHETAFSKHIAKALKAVANTGTQLYFMAGNRDFLLGDQYCAAAGMTRLSDPTLLILSAPNTETALKQNSADQQSHGYALMHGDSLCTDDQAYMQFRTMVRNPAWQQAFLSKPIEERLDIARAIRTESKNRSQQAADHKHAADREHYDQITDVSPDSVDHQMAQLHVKTLIHGHTHRPKIHLYNRTDSDSPVDQPKRIVLGDWDQQGWYLLLHQGDALLKSFTLDEP